MAALGAVPPATTLPLNSGFTVVVLVIVAIGLAMLVKVVLINGSAAPIRGIGERLVIDS